MVMPSKEAKTNSAAGIDAEGGRRPTAVPAPATAAPELLDRPRRRTFTAQTKLRVLAETDGAADVRGERPSTFWWCIPRKKTWSMGFCGLESGDAYGDPD